MWLACVQRGTPANNTQRLTHKGTSLLSASFISDAPRHGLMPHCQSDRDCSQPCLLGWCSKPASGRCISPVQPRDYLEAKQLLRSAWFRFASVHRTGMASMVSGCLWFSSLLARYQSGLGARMWLDLLLLSPHKNASIAIPYSPCLDSNWVRGRPLGYYAIYLKSVLLYTCLREKDVRHWDG